jgi:hypothetical protein
MNYITSYSMVGGLTRLSLQDVCRQQKPTPSIVFDYLHESITHRRFIVENMSIPLLLDCPSGEHDGCASAAAPWEFAQGCARAAAPWEPRLGIN